MDPTKNDHNDPKPMLRGLFLWKTICLMACGYTRHLDSFGPLERRRLRRTGAATGTGGCSM